MVPSMRESGMSSQATDTEGAIKYGAMVVFTRGIGEMIKQTDVDG